MESLKLFSAMAAILVVVGGGLGVSMGLITFQKDGYSCFPRKFWYQDGEARWLAVGSMNLMYPLYRWGCKEDHRYDPAVYQISNGQLETRD